MMSDGDIKPGAPLYVPSSEVATAHSFGAVMVEGDGRLFVPNILPEGVDIAVFNRWTGAAARVVWIGELLESVVGGPVDLMDVAGIVAESAPDETDDVVPLYVPTSEMDVVRHISGVYWDRGRRRYVARKFADFALIHKYLTPAMKSAWIAERNIATAMAALVRARALISDHDPGDALEQEL